ncbi:MAG: ANTAR domain-containing protein [Candidatus Faecousia sp.]|nr:ANTAR domain-containing protein [Oscillospiraceae bacterium]MDD6855069.1 ANTAR domain-containing protein [Oscillospiraceae bacterium]MDY2556919.1 ANTAR domain-containing protein [Candidatus Faecousia sp.]
MASGKIIYRVLIAGANDRTFDSLRELLPPDSYEPPLRAGSAGEAKRMLLETDVDLVILNAPLRDEFGTQLALNLAQDNLCVLMLVPAESFDAVCYKVEDEGILTLSKPVSRSGLLGAIKLLTAMRGKLRKLDRQNQALQEKMQDIRTVNRAKWLLIEIKRMTENEAHYYIEKQAMDMRLSRREVAENIIRTYDA